MPRDHKIQIVIRGGNINARVTWMENGKRKALWRSGSTKTEARDRLRDALKERETRNTAGRYGPNAKFSVVMQWYLDRYAVAPVYVDDRKVSGLRSSDSVRGYARALNAFFEERAIGSIAYTDLESYKSERLRGKTKRGKGRSLASVHRELALLRRLFNIAEREGWIAKSPFRRGEPLISVAQERKGSRVLSFEEEVRLLAACTGRIEHLKAILICALDTGMRAGEIFSLKWGDVDKTKIRIRALTTKTAQARVVPVSDRLRLEFKALWEQSEQDDSTPVFGITTVKRSLKSACARAGIEHGEPNGLSFRCLRRTAATRLIQSGLSREEVSKILGHSAQADTTYQHYIAADDRTLDRAREILDRINQNAPPLRDAAQRATAG
jgi:integrase